MLRPFAHLVVCCWMLLRVVAQSLKPVKLFSQQLPTFPLFRDRQSIAQQCWIRLHSSSNIVGATYAHYALITSLGTQGLYSSHDAVQVPNFLGVVTPVCTPLPTRAKQLPTLLAQQCWELLHPFARSLIHLTKMITIRGRLTFKKGFSIQIYISDLAKIILHAIVSNIELRLHLGGLIAKHSLSCATLYASFVLSNLLRILWVQPNSVYNLLIRK